MPFLPSSPCQRHHYKITRTEAPKPEFGWDWVLTLNNFSPDRLCSASPSLMRLTISDLPLCILHSLHSLHNPVRLSPRRVPTLAYCAPHYPSQGSISTCFQSPNVGPNVFESTVGFYVEQLLLGSFKKWSKRVTQFVWKAMVLEVWLSTDRLQLCHSKRAELSSQKVS